MSEVKVTASDIRQYFKTADLDLADLLLEIAEETVKGRKALSKKISDNMAKARGARKGPKAKSAGVVNAEVDGSNAGQVQAVPAAAQVEHGNTTGASESPIAHARARRAAASAVPSVPAPAHTAEATSVASDTIEL